MCIRDSRDRWADIVLRTALWMREAPPEADLGWRELAIVAKALVDGRDVTEIGLMRDIALRTIAVLRDAERMRESRGAFCVAYSPSWGTWQVRWRSQWNRSQKHYIAISITYEFAVLF